MKDSIRRFAALVIVFAVAFFAVHLMQNGSSALRRLFHKDPATPSSTQQFRPEKFTLPEHAPLDMTDVQLLSRLDEEYAKLTDAVTPSVVSIDTMGVKSEQAMDILGRRRVVRTMPTQGQGSGVIVSKEGHIVTNHHVIADQQKIQITLNDGRSFPAILVGDDELLDIAVLKIDAPESTTFQPLKFADSSKIRRGQIVFAIGNPFGLGETITQGIISAMERSISDTQRDLIQTDAAINPGNSGGPLVNLQGEVIGINSAIYSPDRTNPGFQGVGFSIPANDVKDTLYAILERGRPIRSYLGVNVMDVDRRVQGYFGYYGAGALVTVVGAGSPAEKAGLKQNDIITNFAGTEVSSGSQLITLIQRTRVGQSVPLTVWRQGQESQLTATTAESVAPKTTGTQGKASRSLAALDAFGFQVRELANQEKQQGFQGVVVTAVAAEGTADGRLMVNDLIRGVNGIRVDSVADLNFQLSVSAAAHVTSLVVLRGNTNLRIDLPALSGSINGQ
jgi:serine protease Do